MCVILRMMMTMTTTKTAKKALLVWCCSFAATALGFLPTTSAFFAVKNKYGNNDRLASVWKPMYSTTSKKPMTTNNPIVLPNEATAVSNAAAAAAAAVAAASSQEKVDEEEDNPVVVINDFNFRSLLGGDKPVLVDACSKRCGPCKLIEPTLAKFAHDYKDVCVVAKFDIQDRLSQQFKIELLLNGLMPQALPTLLLFYKGQALTKWRGIIRYEQLEEMIAEHLGDIEVSLVETKGLTESDNINEEMDDEIQTGVINFASKLGKADDYMLTDD
jgi:thioredoxin 1